MWQFKITGKPISSKNSRPIYINQATGKRFVGKSPKLVEYTEAAMWEIKSQSRGGGFPLEGDIEATMLFYVPDKRKRDLVNLLQLPCDILEDCGIITDDSQIKSFDGSRIYTDKKYPRTEIILRKRGVKIDGVT